MNKLWILCQFVSKINYLLVKFVVKIKINQDNSFPRKILLFIFVNKIIHIIQIRFQKKFRFRNKNPFRFRKKRHLFPQAPLARICTRNLQQQNPKTSRLSRLSRNNPAPTPVYPTPEPTLTHNYPALSRLSHYDPAAR